MNTEISIGAKKVGKTEKAVVVTEKEVGKKRVAYVELVWLYTAGSILGVLFEGLHTLIRYGQWESHVVSLTLPLCALYGLGAVGCYLGYRLLPRKRYVLQFLFFTAVGTVLELAAGLLLEFLFGMRAWNYSYKPFNFRGHICLSASIGWGVAGAAFSFASGRPLDSLFSRTRSRVHKILTVLLWIYVIADLFLTGACILRWSRRHFFKSARTGFGRWLDRTFPDAFMKKRFCEWRFLR